MSGLKIKTINAFFIFLALITTHLVFSVPTCHAVTAAGLAALEEETGVEPSQLKVYVMKTLFDQNAVTNITQLYLPNAKKAAAIASTNKLSLPVKKARLKQLLDSAHASLSFHQAHNQGNSLYTKAASYLNKKIVHFENALIDNNFEVAAFVARSVEKIFSAIIE